MKLLLPLLLFLVAVTISVQCDSKMSHSELLAHLEKAVRTNHTEISPKCAKHMQQWALSLAKFSAAVVNCKRTPLPHLCDELQQQLLEENFYAFEQIDAFGRLPSNIAGLTRIAMGDYDECVSIISPRNKDYRAHFCWAHINLPVQRIMEATHKNISGLDYSCGSMTTDVLASVCMPRSCSEEDIHVMLNLLPEKIGWEAVCRVSCRPAEVPYTTGFWIVMSLLTLLVGIAILATFIEGSALRSGHSSGGDHVGTKYLLCFSLTSNARRIFSSPDRRKMIHGVDCMRFFSFTWVLAGHYILFCGFSDNSAALLKENDKLYYHIWTNGHFAVDTFFFLSGLMLSYMFLKSSTKEAIKTPRTWLLFYAHRYIRLTVPYSAFILFYTVVVPHLNTGPHEIFIMDESENCRKNWWTNLLYVSNFLGTREQCISLSWYLSNDMQIYVLSPIFLVPFIFSPLGGFLVLVALSIISIALTYYTMFAFKMPGTAIRVGNLNEAGMTDFMYYVYEASYIRVTPYLVGVAVGYILLKTRNTMVVLKKNLAPVLWVVAFAMAIAVIFIPYNYQRGQYWTEFQCATYHSFARVGWALSLAWVVFAINNGYGGGIGKFMSLPFWTPLGRLTYCGYLCHIMVITFLVNMERKIIHYEGLGEVVRFLHIQDG
ncbi:hypothetical protein Y032_0008g171 [Ancylostoma ceylanicum]|uniref:Nose resistant-to-fluoxetine protein N-terminal domain-containing protein n=1 Tax=Ancylostoma ceylanicum TaxID=53326 RepID=A0A016VK06_9BILA|nr:hypothetical protein Y032_0008g171 [Ancylostoma ceylanicum]